MPIDASIPLQAKTPHFMGPQDVLSLQSLLAQSQMNQLKVRQAEEARQSMDALRTFYSDRNNFDEKGYVKPDRMNAMLALNPLVGEKIMDSESTRRMREAQLSTQTRLLQEADRKAREAESQRVSLAGLSAEMAKPTEEQTLAGLGLVRNPPGSANEFGIANPKAYQQAQQTPFNVSYQSPERMEQLRLGAVPLSQLGTYLKPPPGGPLSGTKAVAGGYIRIGPDGKEEFVRTQAPTPHERMVYDPSSPTKFSWEDAVTYVRRPGAPPPSNASAMSLGVNPDNAHLHGEEYIATLPPDIRNTVRSVVSYRVPLTTLSQRTGERRMILEHAAQADPNFDAKEYPARQRVVNDFTSGKTAGNITSNNMAISHLGTFYDLGMAIENGDVRAFNFLKNRIAHELGRPELNNMAMSSQAVGEELMRVFRQVNASESEAKMFMEKLGTSNSPDQIKGAVKTAVELMKGRLDSLNDQWKRGMKTKEDFEDIVSPKSQEVLKRIGLGGALGGSLASGPGWTPEKERRYQELLRRRENAPQ